MDHAISDSIDLLRWLPWPWSGALGGLIGAVIGSYLATVFVRLPQGRSANIGRSRCDGCGRALRGFELVPLLSWIILRGRCRSCGCLIDPAHGAMELLCAASGAAAFAMGAPLLAPMIWLLVLLAMFDASYLWLPDRLVLAAAVACFIAPSHDVSLTLRIAGGAIGFAVLWLIAAGFHWTTGRRGMGGGDPKLFGAIGLWCGALQLPAVMLFACVIGFGDVLRRRKHIGGPAQMQLPLGTYLSISAVLTAAYLSWSSMQLPANLTVVLAS